MTKATSYEPRPNNISINLGATATVAAFGSKKRARKRKKEGRAGCRQMGGRQEGGQTELTEALVQHHQAQ